MTPRARRVHGAEGRWRCDRWGVGRRLLLLLAGIERVQEMCMCARVCGDD